LPSDARGWFPREVVLVDDLDFARRLDLARLHLARLDLARLGNVYALMLAA
jgi:hypothetical protein